MDNTSQWNSVKPARRSLRERYEFRLPEVPLRIVWPDNPFQGPRLLASLSYFDLFSPHPAPCFIYPISTRLLPAEYGAWLLRLLQVHYEISGVPDSVLSSPLCTYTCVGNGGTDSVWNSSTPPTVHSTGLLILVVLLALISTSASPNFPSLFKLHLMLQ